jgi:hypothetical protein
MPVFAALAGGKVALYHPLQAPAGGKVLYRPLQLLQRSVKYFTARWSNFFGVDIFFCAKFGKQLKKVQILYRVHF